jgi:hypothetical protein
MGSERAVMPRHEMRAAVAFWGSNLEGGGTISNISVSGALIEPASPSVLPGTPLKLFVNGVEFSSVELSAEVVRTTGAGFAVSFEELGAALGREAGLRAPANPRSPGAGPSCT